MRHRPYCLIGPGQAAFPFRIPHSLPRVRGRAERRGPYDPAGLCTVLQQEVHRLSTECRFPRRPARSVYRFAPLGPRWTDLVIHRCGTPASAPPGLPHRAAFENPGIELSPAGRCFHPIVASAFVPVTRGWRAGNERLGPPGGENRAASPTPRPGHRSPPQRLETLIRHPSLAGAGWMGI